MTSVFCSDRVCRCLEPEWRPLEGLLGGMVAASFERGNGVLNVHKESFRIEMIVFGTGSRVLIQPF